MLLARGNSIGQNATSRSSRRLICEAAGPFVEPSTSAAGVPLEPNGDFRIDDLLNPVPSECPSPVLLIGTTTSGAWVAAGITSLEDDDQSRATTRERDDVRVSVATVMVGFSLWVWGCSSSTGYDGSPVAPTPALPTDVVMVDVISINGAQSFSPNPATLPAGHTVVWRNVDRFTHRVVFQNGMLDTGNIAPGASSQPVLITTGGSYHCSIHPSMVGTVVAPSALSAAN